MQKYGRKKGEASEGGGWRKTENERWGGGWW